MNLSDIVTQVKQGETAPTMPSAQIPTKLKKEKPKKEKKPKRKGGLFARCCAPPKPVEPDWLKTPEEVKPVEDIAAPSEEVAPAKVEQAQEHIDKHPEADTVEEVTKRLEEVPETAPVEPSAEEPPAQKRIYACNYDYHPPEDALLPPPTEQYYGKPLLVLDLDETLVHSSFNFVDNADLEIDLAIEDPYANEVAYHKLFVYKRPYVDEFLERMAKYYEICVFTASLQVYCDAVMEQLDPKHIVPHKLYRNSCTMSNGIFVKDMSKLGRPLESIIILDNAAASYLFHPENGILAVAFYDDKEDTFLKDIEDLLAKLSTVNDVRVYLSDCQ